MPHPRKLVPIVLLAASFGTAHADRRPAKPSPEQIKVRDKLLEADPVVVRKDLRPYAPLCDADGYPLVGNAAGATKGGPSGLQPSEYCVLVRAAKAPKAT